MKKQYFTLMELLIVIMIIAILASMLLPALKQAQDMGKGAVCKGNLRQLYQCFLNYASDYNEYFVFTVQASPPGCGFGGPAEPHYWINQFMKDLYGDTTRQQGIAVKYKIFYCPTNSKTKIDTIYPTQAEGNFYGYGYPNNHDQIGWGGQQVLIGDKEYTGSAWGNTPLNIMPKKRMISLKQPSKSIVFGDWRKIFLYNDYGWFGVNHGVESANYVMADGHVELLSRTFLTANGNYLYPLRWQ